MRSLATHVGGRLATAALICICLGTGTASGNAAAAPQHQHHPPPPKKPAEPAKPSEPTPPSKPPAQQPPETAKKPPEAGAQPAHEHAQAPPRGWRFMHDGVLFATFNRQGGPRGDTEFRSQNWWMGMLSRNAGRGTVTLTGMFSLEPATVGAKGYGEIFQIGETYRGRPLVDRQHPHDLVMQLAAAWRVPLKGDRTSLTLAAAPIGEPALGPVAFMHRPSAADNPSAPLGHHVFDSSHIAMGVVTAAIDRHPWTVEASLFNGREPDEQRWDVMDPGALDSWSFRFWLRPAPEWQLQVSHGLLKDPEPFEPGNVHRTTGSAAWFREGLEGFAAVMAAYGRNNEAHGVENAFLLEATRRAGPNTLYGRFEARQLDTQLLTRPEARLKADTTSDLKHSDRDESRRDVVSAFTIGGVRELSNARGFEIGLGADVTFYGTPDVLERTHGKNPVSFHIFLRIRPPASAMGRMWNMTMARPMRH